MRKLLKEKKIALVCVILVIVGWAVYFSFTKPKSLKNEIGLTAEKNCESLPELVDGEEKLVTKVIDGDTFLIEGGYSVRILGIDTDEKGYPCYEKAKEKLEELILQKRVRLERGQENFDHYCRYLRYVFLEDKNISLELVKNGLAVARFSKDEGQYTKEIALAEKEARERKIGCKWGGEKIFKEEKGKFKWQKLTKENLGLVVVEACSAGKYLGKEIIVEGKIVDSFWYSKSNTVFLNFEKPYPNQCFTAVIFKSSLDKFMENPEKYYLKKTVRIFGKVKEYNGRPEIILETPAQIEIGTQ